MQEGPTSTLPDIQTNYTEEERESFDRILYISMVGHTLKAEEMIGNLSKNERLRYEAYSQDVKKIQHAELQKLSKLSLREDLDPPKNSGDSNGIHTQRDVNANEEIAFLLRKKDKYDRKLQKVNRELAQLEEERSFKNKATLTPFKKRQSW